MRKPTRAASFAIAGLITLLVLGSVAMKMLAISTVPVLLLR